MSKFSDIINHWEKAIFYDKRIHFEERLLTKINRGIYNKISFQNWTFYDMDCFENTDALTFIESLLEDWGWKNTLSIDFYNKDLNSKDVDYFLKDLEDDFKGESRVKFQKEPDTEIFDI